MKPISYEETFKIIPHVKDVNTKVLDNLVSKLKEFTSGIDLLIASLFKNPFNLPTKRQKKLLKFSKNVKGQTDFDNIDPNFTKIWENIAIKYLNKNPGLGDLNESLKTIFISKLTTLRDEYAAKMNHLEALYNSVRTIFYNDETNFKKADGAYRSLCQQIEELHQKIQAETAAGKPDEIISKLKQQFAEAKNNYMPTLEEAISANKKLNDAHAKFSLECEKLLLMFEEIDKERAEKLNAIMLEFADAPREITNAKRDATKGFLDEIQEILAVNEVIQPEPDVDNLKPLTLIFEPKLVSFSIDEFLEPKKIFSTDLKQSRASLKMDYSINNDGKIDFPRGTIVTIVGTKLTKSKIVNEETGQCAKVPSSVLQKEPRLDRKLAKLKVDIIGENPSQITAQAGQTVVVNTIENGIAKCTDMYSRKSEIPVDNLQM
ncbi:hypothetical protein TRFO_03023 [Tritrichomonas foetus]|uniref:Uncharacterized protein n=1 Tax=Tritrichomonas foetus TaxID=1144522 RepID=A0A1J4KYG6_9EUKA|nr:hypothetical protein TRFO_03023 [Tritrichomonas foetus]|eukprot:OHT14750.1 hypothetical protein TRFO_03023 [Tritrichomonas foetus]